MFMQVVHTFVSSNHRSRAAKEDGFKLSVGQKEALKRLNALRKDVGLDEMPVDVFGKTNIN